MNPMKLSLPKGARIIFNVLCRSKDPAHLTQDLLAIVLLNDSRIDVSWYPEHDPFGSYVITVFEGAWEKVEDEHRTVEIDEVVREVERLARLYTIPPVKFGDPSGVSICACTSSPQTETVACGRF